MIDTGLSFRNNTERDRLKVLMEDCRITEAFMRSLLDKHHISLDTYLYVVYPEKIQELAVDINYLRRGFESGTVTRDGVDSLFGAGNISYKDYLYIIYGDTVLFNEKIPSLVKNEEGVDVVVNNDAMSPTVVAEGTGDAYNWDYPVEKPEVNE